MWFEEKKTKKGKKSFKYIERYFDPRTRTYKKVSVSLSNKTRESQKEAQKLLDKKIEELLNTQPILKPDLTFYKLIDEWLPIYKQQVRESTYLPTTNIIKTIKKHIPENYVVSGISTTDLNNMFEEMIYTDGLSNKYVGVIKAKVNLIYTYAEAKRYVLKNPVDDVKITYKREEQKTRIKDKFLEDDEYKRLVQYTMNHNERYGLLFQWLYLTGMRFGEAAALQSSDIIISDTRRYAVVNGTLLYRSRKIEDFAKSQETKTEAGMREVELSQKAVDIANQSMSLNKKSGFLFQTSNGTPFSLQAVNNYLRTHREKMDIDKPVSSHFFRHTHVSKLAELGTPLHAIQERVGHENSNLTEQIYLHVTKNVKDKLIADIEKL